MSGRNDDDDGAPAMPALAPPAAAAAASTAAASAALAVAVLFLRLLGFRAVDQSPSRLPLVPLPLGDDTSSFLREGVIPLAQSP